MKTKKTLLSVILSGIIALGLTNKATAQQKADFIRENIKIANWNLQAFGNKKASNPELLQIYSSIINDYDIIFVQEIRDKDEDAFPALCSLLSEHNYKVSSRAGRTPSKEQYGVIYKKDIEITDFKDFNPDPNDRWERPPIEIKFSINNYNLTVYNIHTKPKDTPKEIDNLEKVVENQGNTIVLGDLNADCSYYNASDADDFDSWHWIINDDEDTTSSPTNCAYDRIILNEDAYKEYVNGGIYNQINKDVSDHYLVWVELSTYSQFDLNKDGIVNFKDYAVLVNNLNGLKKENLKNIEEFTKYWLYKP